MPVLPQIQAGCSGSSRIAQVVLAMLSAPSSRSLPMVSFAKRPSAACGALPVRTVEASSANTTSRYAGSAGNTTTEPSLSRAISIATSVARLSTMAPSPSL